MAVGLPRAAVQKLQTWKLPALAKLTTGIGSEFMPPLNEGSMLFMPVLLPSTSLTEVKRIMAWQDEVISKMPEVASVAGKLGRAETATDPAPVEMIETTVKTSKADFPLRFGAYPVEGHRVWGATARILGQLGAMLGR